ncbi:autophagy protein 12-like [Nasonia vitripennis]|uniref:Ubiquitin-like protein ATG12 n=1 Tax=Nasonia vitripennis TaxID=7425 RepID=A0A7M7G9N1_NASVI|nr:autophagy protein 12-like [Nasonia vitripennis]
MADKEEDRVSEGSATTGAETPEATTASNEETPQEPASIDANLTNNEAPPPPVKGKKIEVLLKATGDAPIMMKKKWVVSQDQTIGWISEFIKKCIKLGTEERLFLYINQTFAPAPDQTVKNLYDCYGSDGKLIIHYCKSQAWG